MTLRHIRIFVSVYRNSSITKAARELHLAQPSVSFSIRELEEYYGQRFFERIGRRIYPTEAAREFYGYAVHIVSVFEKMEKEMKNKDEIGVIRVGASITIGTHILPSLIRKFQEKFPDIRMEAVVNCSSEIEQLLLQNEIDVGLIENQPFSESVCSIPFMEDSLAAIVSVGHELTGRGCVSLKEMAEYPFLMREKGSAGREILDASFHMEQINVHPAWESSSTQAIVQGVAKNLGVAVLPYLLVKRDVEQGVISQVRLCRPIRRKLNIIYHRSKYISKGIQTFMDLCMEFGRRQNEEEETDGKTADHNQDSNSGRCRTASCDIHTLCGENGNHI